jgi:hypothetical protein
MTTWLDNQDGGEITLEMMRAGVEEAREHILGLPLEELVKRVYLAMFLEAAESKKCLSFNDEVGGIR